MEDQEVLEARAKLAQKFGGSTRTGGKGTMKRTKKVVHKTNTVDDKKLRSSMKKLGTQPLPAIEEANMFMEDNTVMHFTNPEVQANIRDNFMVISGNGEVKSIKDLMPGILPQLGPKDMQFLKDFLQTAQTAQDEEVPELVGEQNFEDIAEQD